MSRFTEIDKDYFVKNVEQIGHPVRYIKERVWKDSTLRQIVEEWMAENSIHTPLCELIGG